MKLMEQSIKKPVVRLTRDPTVQLKLKPLIKLTRIRVFTCDICLEIFPTNEKLGAHIKTHKQIVSGTKTKDCNNLFQKDCSTGVAPQIKDIQHQETDLNKVNGSKNGRRNKKKGQPRVLMTEKNDNGTISCTMCKKEFANQAIAAYHYHAVHKKLSRCEICKQKFNTHENDYVGQHPFKCNYCDTSHTFTLQSSLNTHLKKFHADLKLLNCRNCFPSYVKYKTEEKPHSNANVKNDISNGSQNENNGQRAWITKRNKDGTFSCRGCSKEFSSHFKATRHYEAVHLKLSLKCEVCSKEFNSKHLYYTHKYYHLKKWTFKCNYCGKSYSAQHELNIHLRSQHAIYKKEYYKCDKCGKEYVRKYVYEAHIMLKHNDDKTYACKECPSTFTEVRKLIAHHRLQHSKDLHCTMCTKTFYRRCHLKTHINISHLKLRNFECDYCGKKYSDKVMLRTHIKNHMKNELRVVRSKPGSGGPFLCESCGHSFEHEGYLKEHIKRIHIDKMFECYDCGKSFYLKYMLQNHILKAHREHYGFRFSYTCDYCGQNYQLREQIVNHIHKKHTSKLRVTCKYCQRKFSVEYIKRHVRSMHKAVLYCNTCLRSFVSQRTYENHKIKGGCKRKETKGSMPIKSTKAERRRYWMKCTTTTEDSKYFQIH